MEPLLISIPDAAKALGLCRAQIYNLLNAGKLTSVKLGRRRVVHIESIRKLAATGHGGLSS